MTNSEILPPPPHLSSQFAFPRQTLPYGVFRPAPGESARVGVAVGRWVLDLAQLDAAGAFAGPALRGRGVFDKPALNDFMGLGRAAWDEARAAVRAVVDAWPTEDPERSPPGVTAYRLDTVEMLLPAKIGDYTDFYSSREHATNVGTMFRGPEAALMPNWLHLPIAYHGRAGTIGLGGDVRRPCGQTLPPGATTPIFGATRELDFELEVGFFVGPGNRDGRPIATSGAADHIFGLVLVNDWSARDIQRWEYRPLGPFLSKSFATSISPWVVPLAALEAFRRAGPPQKPTPLPHLQVEEPWAFDIHLEATLQSAAMAAAGLPPQRLTRTNFAHLYWNMAQQLAHHTSNGCVMRPGDLLASGTISGPEPGSYGSLLELTWGGERPIALPTGETRRFLEDGDRLALSGWCERDGVRVGFGEVAGVVLPAHA